MALAAALVAALVVAAPGSRLATASAASAVAPAAPAAPAAPLLPHQALQPLQTLAAAAADTGTGTGIGIHSSPFESSPARVHYFANSESVVLQESGPSGAIWLSTDEGRSWARAKGLPAQDTRSSVLVLHPHAKDSTAFLLTRSQTHYITSDRGASWLPISFPLPASNNLASSLSFHPVRPSYIMYRGLNCAAGSRRSCHEDTYYTTDSFKTSKLLLPWTSTCLWAQNIDPANKDLDSTALCTEWPAEEQSGDVANKDISKLRLVKSSKFFAGGDTEILATNIPLLGIADTWMLAVSKHDASGSNMDLYLSKDAKTVMKASFPDSPSQQGYTVLESSSSALFVDILSADPHSSLMPPFGALYKSDSDGTYFVKSLDHTNRDIARGQVDFERVQAPFMDGILIANTVTNWREMADRVDSIKKLATLMSFDNGRRWAAITPPVSDMDGKPWNCKPNPPKGSTSDLQCALHLHSVTSSRNVGKVFSTTSAPGILVGVGSVGSYLAAYEACDTFFSDDAGKSWHMAMRGPAKYEILDMGALIVLIPDSPRSDQVLYSSNRGQKWDALPVKVDGAQSWTPLFTLLDPESTSQRMIMAISPNGDAFGPGQIVQLDFQKLHSRKCDLDVNHPDRSKDFELWRPPGSDDKGCLLGQSVGYFRVKADANCYVGEKFKHPKEVSTVCSCSAADFECDIGFEPEAGSDASASLKCVPSGLINDQPLGCKVGEKYWGRSGYRKIPGDLCKGGDESLLKPVERVCQNTNRGPVEPPEKNRPVVHHGSFDDRLDEMLYVPGTSTILALTRQGVIRRSGDEGITWDTPESVKKLGKRVLRMGLHETVKTRVFIFTEDDIYVSDDAFASAKDLAKFEAADKYNTFGIKIIDFHPDHPDWYVYVTGGRDCPDVSGCYTKTYTTKDAGKTFTLVDSWSNKCVWARDFGFNDRNLPDDALICSSFKYKKGSVGQDRLRLPGNHRDNPAHLVLLSRDGRDTKVLIDAHVMDFYVVDGIMVVAVGDIGSPSLYVSTDGQSFREAKFPPNVAFEMSGYTLLESTTGGVFLDVAQGLEDYGMLFKSNQNGEYFSKSLSYTHRSSRGVVDFEKLRSVPGIILANRVVNPHDPPGTHRVESLMSYDDGSTWTKLVAPDTDSTGARIKCSDASKCALHLHGISASSPSTLGLSTERSTAASAGLLLGVGNVGDSLLAYNLGNVFVSTDAGRSWTEALKDAHKWAIADSGGLLVLVNDEKPVDTLSYSWDFGRTWAAHKFSDRPVRVEEVTTKPGADSRKVLVTGHYIGGGSGSGGELDTAIIAVDFEKLFDRNCDPKTDFEAWYPGSAPGTPPDQQQRCFFGQETSYIRRRPDAVCAIGSGFNHVGGDTHACPCTAADYECDYNFFRSDSGSCVLFGLDPDQPKSCPLGSKYQGSSGYRRLSLSKCKGGIDLAGKTQRECRAPETLPGQVLVNVHAFPAPIDDFFYFNETGTVVVKDAANAVFVSKDEGRLWARVLENAGSVFGILDDPYYPRRAFFMTETSDVWYTDDGGAGFGKIAVPSPPHVGLAPVFLVSHPKHAEWLLFVGAADCAGTGSCHTLAHVSYDFGRKWTLLTGYVSRCSWAAGSQRFVAVHERGVVCEVFNPAVGDQRVLVSKDLVVFDEAGNSAGRPLFATSGFAVFDEFMVAAVPNADSRKVQVQVSMDAQTWAPAIFPSDTLVRSGYTVLDSSSGSVFLHAIQSTTKGLEHGSLLKSNWNGTFYREILQGVNQNHRGFVDFEKVAGVPGAMVANVVSNIDDVRRGESKKIQTKISFDDGETWSLLAAPKTDATGRDYTCTPHCYLHLHAYTERHDPRDQLSSTGAVGTLMGVGNVGPHLTEFNEGDTFISRDGGRSWTAVVKEAHMLEVGDHGGLILLVNDETYTDTIKFSVDGGQTVNEIRVDDLLRGNSGARGASIQARAVGASGTGEARLRVTNILTEPSGTTPHFIVLGKVRLSGSGVGSIGSADVQSVAIHVDFTHVWARKCEYKPSDPSASDFEAWVLAGSGSPCLFGTNTTLYRRKADRDCSVGETYKQLPQTTTPCACKLSDFECDYGWHSEGNSCVPDADTLANGATCSSVSHGAAGPGGVYQGIHEGYRRRGISAQCTNADAVLPPSGNCAMPVGSGRPGSGTTTSGSWTFVILMSIVVSGAVTWAALHYQNGGFGRYGSLRLPLDADEERAGGRPGRLSSGVDWRDRAAAVVAAGGTALVGVVAGAVVVGHAAVDWVRARMNRDTGYTPLRTTAVDPFSADDDLLERRLSERASSGALRDAFGAEGGDGLDLDWNSGDDDDGDEDRVPPAAGPPRYGPL
ncbi:hypothetical protein BC831DRAFT_467920 [Entophlyctis helioformis]|nr:hypothetical protein BC831DRAFT_467920 [Entophlyctis helioformis]